MRGFLKSRDNFIKCLGFVLLFGCISLGAIGGCNANVGGHPRIGSGPGFVTPLGIAVEADGNLVVDTDSQAVLRVDPISGNRTIISAARTSSGQ
jgi:hypothetical protein